MKSNNKTSIAEKAIYLSSEDFSCFRICNNCSPFAYFDLTNVWHMYVECYRIKLSLYIFLETQTKMKPYQLIFQNLDVEDVTLKKKWFLPTLAKIKR